MDHAHAIQQSHSDNIQHLEREAIEEGGKDHQSFLATCGNGPAGLFPRRPWGINVPSSIADGEHVSDHSPGHPYSGIHCQGGTYPCDLPSSHSHGTCTLLRNKMVAPFSRLGSMLTPSPQIKLQRPLKSCPTRSRKTGCLLRNS